MPKKRRTDKDAKPVRMTQLFAYIARSDDGEGLCAFRDRDGWVPMVGDYDRADSLRQVARTIARQTGQRILLVKYTKRETIAVIDSPVEAHDGAPHVHSLKEQEPGRNGGNPEEAEDEPAAD